MLINNMKNLTYHKQLNTALSSQESASPQGFQRLMVLSLSIRFKVFPTCGVGTLTAGLGGGENYQMWVIKVVLQKQRHRLEVSSSRLFWGWVFSRPYVIALPK